MTLMSAIRYRDFLLRQGTDRDQSGGMLALRMRRSIEGDLWLRTDGTDMLTFDEIVIRKIYDCVFNKVNHCDYVIDLGANIGLATRLFAARYPGCKILAVEPDPDNYALLERNLTGLVRAGRCRTFEGAVWGRKSRLAVTAPAGHEDLYNSMFVYETLDENARLVDSMTMPELLEHSGFPRVDLLKVDIEGAEVALFGGDTSWLERIGAIAIEFHEDSREQSGFDRIIERSGFDVDDANLHTIVAVRRQGCGLQRAE
jgi:FkbM family methyltransferase